ncbi:IS5/IS1182 family transposase, partial [bacterium endosymbiont of Escarpia laminata]
MIRYCSQKQLTLAEFDWPFQTALDENNRWVKMGECIPWDELAEGYYQGLSTKQGRPAKDARLVIGAVIIKHKLCLSDQETVAQIQENPYLQYFVGLPGYQMEEPFAPSLFVEIRKRM